MYDTHGATFLLLFNFCNILSSFLYPTIASTGGKRGGAFHLFHSRCCCCGSRPLPQPLKVPFSCVADLYRSLLQYLSSAFRLRLHTLVLFSSCSCCSSFDNKGCRRRWPSSRLPPVTIIIVAVGGGVNESRIPASLAVGIALFGTISIPFI